jgi:hypothetical protein
LISPLRGDQLLRGAFAPLAALVTLASRLQRAGVPLQLVEEMRDAPLVVVVDRRAIFAERVLDLRDGKDRGDARHAEFCEYRAQCDGSPHAAEGPCRVTDDRARFVKVLLQEVIE